MSRKYRWAYMADPRFNPPNNACPDCSEPSRTFHIGDRPVDDGVEHHWKCEHRHEWMILERRGSNPPAPA